MSCRWSHHLLNPQGGTSSCNSSPIAVDRTYHSTLILLSCLWIGLAAVPVPSQTAPSQTAPIPTTPRQPASPSPNLRPVLKLGSQGNEVSELQAMLKLLGFYTEAVNGLYQESTANAVAAFQQAAGIQPDGIVGVETWNRLLPAAPAANPSTATTPTPNLGSPTPATPTPVPTATVTPAPQTPTATPNYTPATPNPTPSTPSTPSTTSSVEFPILRVGMNGDAVTRLQERLKAIGLFSGAVDGVFGPETESAVQAAQRNYNLEPDGIVGPATWKALFPGS